MKINPFLLTAALGLALGFTGCKPAASEEDASVTTEVGVQVGKLTRATLHRYVTAYGMVEPEPAHDGKAGAGARLASPVAGIVAEVNCAEGQRVEKGALLFRLDGRPADVAVQFAEQTLERQKKLLPLGGTSQKALQEAEQQLATARAQQALLRIEAPFAGVITRVNVQPGEAVDLTSVLGELVDPDRLIVTAAVPAAEAEGLKAGQTVEFSSDAKVLPTQGEVAFVSPQIDARTGTALVRASVPAGAALRAGQYVNLRITTEDHPNCLAVPLGSVVKDEEGQTVLALVDGDKAMQKPVKAGVKDGNLVEVSGDGLKEGDTVVTVGAYALPKETKIKIIKP